MLGCSGVRRRRLEHVPRKRRTVQAPARNHDKQTTSDGNDDDKSADIVMGFEISEEALASFSICVLLTLLIVAMLLGYLVRQ